MFGYSIPFAQNAGDMTTTVLNLPRAQIEKIERFWQKNHVRACGVKDAIDMEDGTRTFVRRVGGEPASVTVIGNVEGLTPGVTLRVYRADLGYHGKAILVTGKRFGTCWYTAFSPAIMGTLNADDLFPWSVYGDGTIG